MYGKGGSDGVVLAKSNATIVISICGGSTQASTAAALAAEELTSSLKSHGV